MAVRVFSTPTCSFCTQLKQYLRERHVQFTDYDVSKDERKAAEMVHRSSQTGVPVLDFNGSIIVGFDKQSIDRLIDRSRYS
jgi:glutaredoxin-like YruB-family protein